MKAYLKSNRKVIVEVTFYDALPREKGNGYFILYVDTKTGDVYKEDELEFKEYQGG